MAASYKITCDQNTDFERRHEQTLYFITKHWLNGHIKSLVLKVCVDFSLFNLLVLIFHLLHIYFLLIHFCAFFQDHRFADAIQTPSGRRQEKMTHLPIYLQPCITFFLTLSLSLPSTLILPIIKEVMHCQWVNITPSVRRNSCGSLTRDSFALCQFRLVALNTSM